MRHNILAAVVISLCLGALPCGLAPARAETPVFFDNFEGVWVKMPDGGRKLYPDPAKWAFTFWPGSKWPDSYGNGTNWLEANGECQTYVTPFAGTVKGKKIPFHLRYDPFTITDGGLHIRADLLTPEQRQAYKVHGFRRFGSGMLLSKTSFRYGRISMVAKLPSQRGAWPAFWLLSEDHEWPPEIDIFEAMAWGPHEREIHSGLLTPKDENKTYAGWFDVGVSPADGFHRYTLEWSAKKISMSFDDRLLWERATPPSMNRNMYMIINLAVGGKWPFNELGIRPIDGLSEERLSAGADLIEADYPAEMVIRSVTVSQEGQE